MSLPGSDWNECIRLTLNNLHWQKIEVEDLNGSNIHSFTQASKQANNPWTCIKSHACSKHSQ